MLSGFPAELLRMGWNLAGTQVGFISVLGYTLHIPNIVLHSNTHFLHLALQSVKAATFISGFIALSSSKHRLNCVFLDHSISTVDCPARLVTSNNPCIEESELLLAYSPRKMVKAIRDSGNRRPVSTKHQGHSYWSVLCCVGLCEASYSLSCPLYDKAKIRALGW